MKILLAADGSSYTKKALAFLVTHEFAGAEGHVVVVNVQPAVPPRVKSMVGAASVNQYHADEAAKVLKPIEKFLQQRDLAYTVRWTVGNPGQEIVKAAKKEKVNMVVMASHGRRGIKRLLLGSETQHVLTHGNIPVLVLR